MLEEALFYPTVLHEVKGVESLVDKAVVEHESAKTLITETQAMSAEDRFFDAKVKVLAEQIGHHITEEEQKLEIIP